MAVKTYGAITLNEEENKWELSGVQPHVCIKLKSIFQGLPKTAPQPFKFTNNPETCCDLLWFMERYPMVIADFHLTLLNRGNKKQQQMCAELEAILMPNYKPSPMHLKDGLEAREYQVKAAEFDAVQKRFLLGDDIGLGKTLSAILSFKNKNKLPALVVVQTHLPKQWQKDGVEKFTNLTTHIIGKTKPYDLPPAEVLQIRCLR